MNCKRAQELISLHFDARLDPAGQTRLNRHLESCADCARYLSDLEEGLGALRALPLEEPSESFDWNLRRKLQQAQREPWRYRGDTEQRDFWPRFTVAAAAALLLTLGGAFAAYQAIQGPGSLNPAPGAPVAGRSDGESFAIPSMPLPFPGVRGDGEDAQVVREGAARHSASSRSTIQQTDPGTSLPPAVLHSTVPTSADSLPTEQAETDEGETGTQR